MITGRSLTWVFVLALIGVALSVHSSSSSSSQSVLKRGINVWRKPGAIQGGAACATCHSPDGIELAEYAFDDADIMRRAVPHVGDADARELVAYIHALRTKLKLRTLRDPNLNRPLQPGGLVLEGATPASRDLAFGLELSKKLPLLFNGRIKTVEEAKAAERELLQVDATSLRVGIPLNRLSEDVAHGDEHSSIAQWLPENPPAIPSDHLTEWYAAEDRYLQNPNQQELHHLIQFHQQLVNTSRMLGLGELSAAKFRALLVLQDRMRHHTEATATDVSEDVLSFGNFNPIWDVGEVARQVIDRDPKSLGMTADVQSKKLAGPTLSAQLHDLRVSWFWAGWLSDQGLFKTSHDDRVRLGMWLSESLSKDGPYAIHSIYANVRRQAVVSNLIDAWGEPLSRRRRIWDFAGLRAFQRYEKDIPADPVHRRLYIAFTTNSFRMNLLLLEDDIRRSGEVWQKVNTRANLSELIRFIEAHDPDDKQPTEDLKQRLGTLVESARERS